MSLREKYDPEFYHKKAEEYLDTVNKAELDAWVAHPCTKALLTSLEGDMAGLTLMWLNGGYSSEESVDATAQQQAKARGMAQAIDDIILHIQNIKTIRDTEEVDD